MNKTRFFCDSPGPTPAGKDGLWLVWDLASNYRDQEKEFPRSSRWDADAGRLLPSDESLGYYRASRRDNFGKSFFLKTIATLPSIIYGTRHTD
jgi:hypothetical protein